MKTAVFLILAAMLTFSPAAEARTRKPHAPRVHAPRVHKPRAPRTAYRTVRIHRADGSTSTGYRDSLGTHLTRPDGRTVNCRRNVGAADIDVTCR